jgi:Rieske Fe-S protein
MADPNPVPTRRRFINWFLGTSVGALLASIVYPVTRFVSPPQLPEATTNQVEAGTTNDPELREKGFKIVRFGADPVILVRASETDFRAFSATCTHLDCIVEYHADRKRIFCNCHAGEYDLQGKNVGGPPPKPLTAYTVKVESPAAGQPGIIVIVRT